LISLLEIAATTSLEAVDALRVEPVTLNPTHLLELALQQRPDYLSSLLSLDVAGLDALVARNNRLWDLSLEGTYSLSGMDKQFDNTFRDFGARPVDNWSVGLALTVPLHDLSRQQAVVNTRVAAEQAQVRVEEARHQVEVEVRDGARNVLVSWQQVELAQRVRELSEKQLEVEKEKLQVGRSSNFQLITLQNNLALAQVQELNAILTYLNAQTLLDKTLGTTLATWRLDLSAQ
jgi:outer membrane protein TolC